MDSTPAPRPTSQRQNDLTVVALVAVGLALYAIPPHALDRYATAISRLPLISGVAAGVAILAIARRVPHHHRFGVVCLGLANLAFGVAATLRLLESNPVVGPHLPQSIGGAAIALTLAPSLRVAVQHPERRDPLAFIDGLLLATSSALLVYLAYFRTAPLFPADRWRITLTISALFVTGTFVICHTVAPSRYRRFLLFNTTATTILFTRACIAAWTLPAPRAFTSPGSYVAGAIFGLACLAATITTLTDHQPTRSRTADPTQPTSIQRRAAAFAPTAIGVSALLVDTVLHYLPHHTPAHPTTGAVIAIGLLLLARGALAAGSVRQIEARRRAHIDTLRYRARHDAATGLPTLTHLIETTPPVDPTTPRLVMAIELPDLAVLERSLGRSHADVAALRCAQRILNELPPTARCGRLEGGTFYVILTDPDDPATGLAQRLRDSITQPQRLGPHEVATTVAIGISRCAPTYDLNERVSEASAAVTTARATPGRIAHYRAEARDTNLARLRLASDLRRCLTNHEIDVSYQPIVRLDDRRIVGAEALIRWLHPTEGVLLPDRWLDIAENIGLLTDIATYTLDDVTRRFATLNAGRPNDPLFVQVNVSASELRDGYDRTVFAALERSRLDPAHLRVEMPGLISRNPQGADAVHRLVDAGVGISLGNLMVSGLVPQPADEFAVTQLKLPDVPYDQFDQPVHQQVTEPVILNLTGICHRHLIEVVACGITTERGAEVAQRLGCTHGQGWLFGRPTPFSRFAANLERMDAAAAPSPVNR